MDSTTLAFLAAPFAASLILTGIHAYLGIHVVERGVIFVDLSLAQIAAFGATIALLMPWSGDDPHGNAVYWTSLAFTFFGAAIFAQLYGILADGTPRPMVMIAVLCGFLTLITAAIPILQKRWGTIPPPG